MRAKLIVTCLGLAIAAWMIAPTVASAQDNHYACYQVKDLKVPGKLAKGQAGTHTTAGVHGPALYEKCKLKYLCSPTSKDGSIIADPNLHYLCHQCKGFKGKVAFDVTDQFVTGRVETKKLKFICNPAASNPA
jgi:hypothetical protein